MNEPVGPDISIVMPCYNASAYLGKALRSVLDQEGPSREVLLVDDGSTDDPESIVRGLSDPRISFRRIPPSGGPSRPRNLAMAEARGRYVCFFDADDVMLPGKLAAQVAAMDAAPRLAMTFTNFHVMDQVGKVTNPDFLAGYRTFANLRRLVPEHQTSLPREACYLALLRANFIGTSSVVVRREVLDDIGGFDETLASSEDIDMWLRIARSHDCGYVDIVGHGYRHHPASVMHQFRARHPLARIEVLRRHLDGVTDIPTRRAMLRRLAENYSSLGFIWQKRGNAALARRNYLESLRLAPSSNALAGYCKCLLGGAFMRRARDGRA